MATRTTDALAAPPTGMVELAGPLADLCAALTAASPFSERFDIMQTIDGDCLVRRDWLAPIGLIVGEAVTNAIKHARPAGVRGLITVVGKLGDGGASVIDIIDDGVGLPDGVDEATFGGHGIALMRRLSQNIGASLRFTSTALGLRVRLRAPATQAERRADAAAARDPSTKFGESLSARLAKAWPRDAGGQQHYRDLLNALPTAVYTTDAQGRITFYNKAAVDLWGVRPKLGDEWCGSWRLYWPDGEPMAHGECPMAVAIKENRAIRGGEAIAERPDGTRAPFMAYPTPIRDAAGVLVGAVNCLVDISERKSSEDRQKLLAREVHHRTKNLLSVVYSIVSRGLDGGRSVADTRASVLGRVRALGTTYDNLITTSWAGVELSDIVRTELGPYPAQWSVAGPSLVLNPQAAQNFTLAVHELATNAAKYGALSTPEGRVSVDWSDRAARRRGAVLLRLARARRPSGDAQSAPGLRQRGARTGDYPGLQRPAHAGLRTRRPDLCAGRSRCKRWPPTPSRTSSPTKAKWPSKRWIKSLDGEREVEDGRLRQVRAGRAQARYRHLERETCARSGGTLVA